MSDTALKTIRAALASIDPSQADLEAAIVAADARAAAAVVQLEALARTRPTVLLAERSDLTQHDDQVATATFDRDQAVECAAALRRRLEPIVAAVRAATIAAERSGVETAMLAAGKAMTGLPRLVEAARKILRTIAEADVQAAAFAARHPGEPAIPLAEARVRQDGGEPVERGSRQVWAWRTEAGHVFRQEGNHSVALDDREAINKHLLGTTGREWNVDFLAKITARQIDPRIDYVFRLSDGRGLRVYPVRAIERKMEQVLGGVPEALAATIRLPALRLGDPAWAGATDTQAAAVLAKLDAPPARPSTIITTTLEAVEPVQPVIPADAAASPPSTSGTETPGAAKLVKPPVSADAAASPPSAIVTETPGAAKLVKPPASAAAAA